MCVGAGVGVGQGDILEVIKTFPYEKISNITYPIFYLWLNACASMGRPCPDLPPSCVILRPFYRHLVVVVDVVGA